MLEQGLCPHAYRVNEGDAIMNQDMSSMKRKRQILKKNNALLPHLISNLCNVHVLFPIQTLTNSMFCVFKELQKPVPSDGNVPVCNGISPFCGNIYQFKLMEAFRPLISLIYEVLSVHSIVV